MKQNLAKWTPVFWGFGLGLFLSRIAAEAQTAPWPWPVVLVVTIVTSALGVVLAKWASNRLSLVPLGLLWLHVLWPRIDPTLATSVALVVVVAFLFLHLKSVANFWVEAIIFLTTLAIYIYTLAPSILPADSGEFQFVSYILGIAHPPGYPLYTLFGKLFTFIPVGDVAYRVNLLSAVAAAATLVLVSRTLRLVTGSSFAGVLGALVLGGSTTFWAQATTANIRMLTAFFATLILFAAISYAQEKSQGQLILLAASIGLGITHHLSLLLFVPPVLVYLWLADREILGRREWLIKAGLGFLFSLAFILYIPLRAWSGAPFGGEGLKTLPGVIGHILGLGFQGDLFFFAQPELLPERFRVLANILDFQFGLPLLLAIGASGLVLAKAKSRLFILWGGASLLIGFTGITYRAPQTVEYLLPAYIPLVLALGYGVWWLGSRLRSYPAARATLLSFLFLLGIGPAAAHYPSFLALSQDNSPRQYATQVMSQAPQGTTVLANWHRATTLWYLQYVEGARPDLKVQYVFPRGAEPIIKTWSRRLANSVEDGPTVITNYYPPFQATPYRFSPLGDAFLVQKDPSFTIPADLTTVDATFGERIQIIGYQQKETLPSQPLVFDIFWQPVVQLDQNYSFFVHLVGHDGSVVGQMDITRPASRYEVGEILHERFIITPLPTTPPYYFPYSLRLIAGVYFVNQSGAVERLTTQAGKDFVQLAEVQWQPPDQSLPSLHPLYQPFAEGVILTGVDYDTTISGTRRVYLHWRRSSAHEYLEYALFWNEEEAARGRITAMAGDSLTEIDLPSEAWPLQLAVYADDLAASLGPWNLPLGSSISLPGSGSGMYINIGNEMLLMGVEIPGEQLRPGQEFTVGLQIISLRPLTHDYSLSARIGESPPVDTSPTLGDIPTLKWIQGSMIYDRHTIKVPEDALPGKMAITLVVYDAFTLRSLPVLDDRIVRLGANVPLGEVEITAP